MTTLSFRAGLELRDAKFALETARSEYRNGRLSIEQLEWAIEHYERLRQGLNEEGLQNAS